jgi:hypothetical protein
LPAITNWTGLIRVLHQDSLQPLAVAKDQVRSLVGGEPSGETDRQGIVI